MYNNINDILNRFKYTKFSPSVNEWINSYYSYNKNNTFINNNINSLVYLLFNSYFNSFLPEKYKMFYSKKNNSKFYSYKNLFLKNKPYKLEYSTDQNKSIFNFNIKKTSSVSTNKKSAFHNLHLFITKNCSTTLKRIFISIPEIKYYMNHICINLYVFNKERYLIEKKLKTIKKNSLKISNIKNKRTALIIPNTNKKALAISNKNKKYVFNKFIYYNIDNKSFFEETISKRLIETFFYRKYILDLYRNKFKFNVLKFTNIKHMLTNIYNKHIIINIINAKYLFVDNNILLDAIVRKLKNRKRRVLKVMRKAIYLSKVKDIHPLLLIKLEINKIINNYPPPPPLPYGGGVPSPRECVSLQIY